MNRVFISIPAPIFATIYEQFKERSEEVIIETLKRLADGQATNEKQRYSRPKAETTTGKVWAIADELNSEQQAMVSREEVVQACTDKGINFNTASTQYSRWKKAQQSHVAGLHAGKVESKPATTESALLAFLANDAFKAVDVDTGVFDQDRNEHAGRHVAF